MKIVELRRHAERDANEDLTERGLAQCAHARATLEFPYDAYYVSPAKRARLTMEEFGIDEPIPDERLGPRPKASFAPYEARHEELMAAGLDAVSAWFAIPQVVPLLQAHGRSVAEAVYHIATELPDGGRALAVSHGGTIEPFAVIALGQPYDRIFGSELGYCEGVRAFTVDSTIVSLHVVRLPVIDEGPP